MSDIERFLRDRKVRPTAMRMLVLRFMIQQETAISLTELEGFFEKSDRTTLYRTLKTFEENGIVHQINDGNGIPKYALCEDGCNCEVHNDLHLHFHCIQCEETHCLTEHRIPQITLPEGFSVQDMNLVVNGICDKCTSIA